MDQQVTVKRGRWGDHLIGTAATLLIVVAAAFYVLGLTAQTSYMSTFGLDGFANPDTYSLIALGAPIAGLILTWVLGMYLVSVVLSGAIFSVINFLWGRISKISFASPPPFWKRVRDVDSASGALTICFAIILILISGPALGHAYAAFIIEGIRSPCTECRTYHVKGETITGRPIASAQGRAAILVSPSKVVFVRWEDIEAVTSR